MDGSSSQPSASRDRLRYAVDEDTPVLLALGLSVQVVTLVLAGIVLVPIIVLTAAERTEFIEWAVFGTLLVSGLATMLQARPIGPFGAGFPLYMGTSGAFIAVSTAAVALGGLSLLATLVASSALVQFLFSARLSLFRRLITPTVGGTVIMLLAVNVFPIATDMLSRAPEDVDPRSGAVPLVALAAFGTIVLVSLYSRGALQLWAPLLGILVGTAIAAGFGMIDWSPLLDAPWLGLPTAAWPGLDLSFDSRFFGLLLPFAIVTIIGAIETYGDAIAIQRVTRRGEAPVDFRAVQRAVNADGVGNLVSGLVGTMPNTTYSTSVSIADLTGVGARKVAWYGGLLIVLTAFVPKIPALLRLVPDPVAGAFAVVLIVLLFRQGLRMVTTDGLDYEKGLVVCLSFWIGLGFQNGAIFPEHLPDWSRGVLDNGMAAGGLFAVLLTFLMSLKTRRHKRAMLQPRMASVAVLGDILSSSAARAGWDDAATQRLRLAGEEAFLYLMDRQTEQGASSPVSVSIQPDENALTIEFLTGAGVDNLEERLLTLDPEGTEIDDAGPRILAHLGKVRHEQFYDLEALAVTVESRPLG